MTHDPIIESKVPKKNLKFCYSFILVAASITSVYFSFNTPPTELIPIASQAIVLSYFVYSGTRQIRRAKTKYGVISGGFTLIGVGVVYFLQLLVFLSFLKII